MAKPAPDDFIRGAISAVLLILIWLAAFSAANLFNFFKTYSSIWFLPTGVIISVVLVAPGWLKLTPLIANLLLVFEPVQSLLGVTIVNDYEPILHGLRLYAVYGGAALVMLHGLHMRLPFRHLSDVEKLLGTSLVAALVATASGIGMHMLTGDIEWADALTIGADWWLGDALGAILVPPLLVPALMAYFKLPRESWPWPRPHIWIWQAAVIGGTIAVGLLGNAVGLPLWYILTPPPILFALHGGYTSAAVAVVLTCILAPLVLAVFNVQPLFNIAPLLLTVACSALLIGAAIGERESNQKRLRDLVASRTRALEEAHDLQRHLVRSLGHDLRQPVEAINLSLEALAQRPDGDTEQFLQRTRALGLEASQLVSSILRYSRLEVGGIRPILAPFPLSQLIERVDTLYGPIAASREIALQVRYTEGEVFSDQNLLFQVLSNHVDNAVRLSEPGDSVVVEALWSEPGLVLQVCDKIAGQPATPSSSGLGLRIVERIAALLDAQPIYEANCRGLIVPYPQKE